MRRERGWLFLAAVAAATLALAVSAWGQVIVHPNQITGTIGFSNTTPAMLDLLQDPPGQALGLRRLLASAVSASVRPRIGPCRQKELARPSLPDRCTRRSARCRDVIRGATGPQERIGKSGAVRLQQRQPSLDLPAGTSIAHGMMDPPEQSRP